ncbi:MAG: magnesium transporter [Actinobacteria bacterium]|nr:magnesium transporter [Actinomycetota bacterium]MBU1943692.1 magnesium transporter [Actinomycetota bacterium]MBU2686164.1 magnesium transporter [Actinomycetota bacterium]
MEDGNWVILDTVRDMLGRGDLAPAVRTVADLHAADAAEVLTALDMADQVEVLINMEPAVAARALLEMEEPHQVEVAGHLRTGELRGLLEKMPVDEAVDLLGDIPEAQRLRLLKLFGREEAGELAELLAYGDDTAGGLMTPDYISVTPDATAEEVIEELRGVSPEVETIYYVYVVTPDGSPVGVLSLRELILSPPDRKVGDMMSRDLITVAAAEDQELVAETISKYDLLAVPVLDDEGRMLGIVTVDDVMDVIGDEAEEDRLRFAGATGLEDETAGLMAGLGRRLPWFVLAVLIEILVAGGLLKLYSPVLAQYLALVFFIPLLVTMGGNIAVQSSTVMGRWLSSGIPPRQATVRKISGEILWGVLVGLCAGGAVMAISLLFNQGASVGVVVGLSLALTVIAASIVGCALPLTLRAFRRDLGAVSGPLLGTTMDVLSLAIYLVIGRLLI